MHALLIKLNEINKNSFLQSGMFTTKVMPKNLWNGASCVSIPLILLTEGENNTYDVFAQFLCSPHEVIMNVAQVGNDFLWQVHPDIRVMINDQHYLWVDAKYIPEDVYVIDIQGLLFYTDENKKCVHSQTFAPIGIQKSKKPTKTKPLDVIRASEVFG